MDVAAVEAQLAKGDVGTVVVTIGTTGLGVVDPLPDIQRLRDRYDFRIHADAAYGGYFGLAKELGEGPRSAFNVLGEVDSIVIDPHKHGLQPYGCGCVLFRDPSVGQLYKHDSPYTYFSSDQMHLGEITLECSRRLSRYGLLTNFCRLNLAENSRKTWTPACGPLACSGKTCTTAARSRR